MQYLDKDIFADEQRSQDPHSDGDVLEAAGHCVAEHVGDDTQQDTVGNAVGQRHHDDGDEGGNGLAIVVPVDALDGRHHHHAHDDEGGSGSGAGNGQEQRA